TFTYEGLSEKTPAVTNSGATAITDSVTGLAITAGTQTVNTTSSNTINWIGANVTVPTLTSSTAGTVITADGLKVTTSASVTATGTVTNNGLNIQAAGSAGTLNGINISGITASSGAETAIAIGAGWDTGISLTNGASETAFNLDASTTDATLTTGVV